MISQHKRSLINHPNHQAKIELIDWENETKEARYGKFMVDDGIYGYRLTARNFKKELSQGSSKK